MAKVRFERARYQRDMAVRVGLAGDLKSFRGILDETKIGGIEIGMLAGEEQARGDAARLQRVRDRGHFDCFGPGADDQPDVGETQPSP
jgi:hypothetical protein